MPAKSVVFQLSDTFGKLRVEAAGLEPAWAYEAGAKTEVQNVKQHHSLASAFPATIYGAMLPLWAEAAVRPLY